MRDPIPLHHRLELIDRQIEAAEAELEVLKMTRRRLQAEAKLQKLFANTQGFMERGST
jgi:ABC-type phosphate transport system auxiliary subunit